MEKDIPSEFYKKILQFQKNEITEHIFYKKLSNMAKGENKNILEKISKEELAHYNVWKKYTKKDVGPNRFKVFIYTIISRIMGITFAIKLMEGGEEDAQKAYRSLTGYVEEVEHIIKQEVEHENALIDMINEEKLDYIGSMVLGLNDALVEITGTIAGLTFALRNTKLVGLAGVITGIAASLSMASSEYLSRKHEGDKKPLKGSFYTGLAYIFTVFLIVLPYFVFRLYYVAFSFTLVSALLVIYLFTFFVSVVKGANFKKTFLEMFSISFGVALLSFFIGILARMLIGVDV